MTGQMSPAGIRKRREDAGLSRREMAERAGLPISRVWAAEREAGKPVDTDTYNTIMHVLDEAERTQPAEAPAEPEPQPAPAKAGRHKAKVADQRWDAVAIVIRKLQEAAEAPQTITRLRDVVRSAATELDDIVKETA